MIFITGDTHAHFEHIFDFCEKMKGNISKDDIMIILGDVGLNYYLNQKDIKLKEKINNLPLTFFCIHGNHEARPQKIKSYKETEWHGGKVYIEEQFPSLIFAKDGEVYNFGEGFEKTLVIGGAYSVDKRYRLMMGYQWFPDEQPSKEIKEYVENQINKYNGKFDAILTHTTAEQFEPVEWFLTGLDQSTVDKSTEIWLNKIYNMVDFKIWYCGHYHGSKVRDCDGRPMRFMFNDIVVFGD